MSTSSTALRAIGASLQALSYRDMRELTMNLNFPVDPDRSEVAAALLSAADALNPPSALANPFAAQPPTLPGNRLPQDGTQVQSARAHALRSTARAV